MAHLERTVVNWLVEHQMGLLTETHHLRQEVLESITDADLDFSVSPHNPTLRALLLEQGEYQMAYTNAFQHFALRFDTRAPEGIHAVTEMQAWFSSLDQQMISALETLSNADLERHVDRGSWSQPVQVCFHVYRESVLIFAGKASVYLRALGKALPTQTQAWIA